MRRDNAECCSGQNLPAGMTMSRAERAREILTDLWWGACDDGPLRRRYPHWFESGYTLFNPQDFARELADAEAEEAAGSR